MYGMARGIQNNNPMNLRISSIQWKNKIVPSKDHDFEQFLTAYDGIHAGMKNVCNYYKLHGLQTIKDIISRFAPSAENDTNSYITFVSRKLAVDPSAVIDPLDPSVLEQLGCAIIEFENGTNPYEQSLINQVVKNVLA